MLKDALLEIFERDLRKLKAEIELYANESDLWVVQTGISNSAGNLCLHLIGNLNHFIGAILGHSGYVRDRDNEFAAKGISRTSLLEQLNDTIEVVTKALRELPEVQLEQPFPEEKRGVAHSTDYMLVHLLGHLSYHLGQVNYHRRLLA